MNKYCFSVILSDGKQHSFSIMGFDPISAYTDFVNGCKRTVGGVVAYDFTINGEYIGDIVSVRIALYDIESSSGSCSDVLDSVAEKAFFAMMKAKADIVGS